MVIETSLNIQRVIRELKQLMSWREQPDHIRVDNGPEFISAKLEKCCSNPNRKIDLQFIQKGKSSQNSYIEKFKRSYRDDVLNANLFHSL